MKSKILLVIPLLFFVSAVRSPTDFQGTFEVDLANWRAEQRLQKPQITINGVTTLIKQRDFDAWIDYIGEILSSGSLTIRPDGSYALTTPIADITGRWVHRDSGIDATPQCIKPKAPGLIAFNSASFSIRREGDAFRFIPKGESSSSIPIKRQRKPQAS